MTREEIMQLDGYELNVAVAEKVMGYKFPTVEEMKTEAENQWKVQPDCMHFLMGFDAWKADGEFMWRYKTKNYSSDISAAWEVIEKIGQNKFNVEVLRRSDGKYFATCKKVGRVGDKLFEVHAKADSAPEAIVKAALLASMEE